MVPVTGAVLVTTPSVVALADVRKAIEMFRQVNVDMLGIVENMSFFICPHCQERIDVFGHGEGRRIAEAYGVPLLGEIEIDPRIRIGGDTGKPVALLGENAPGAKSIYAMARAVAARLEEKPACGARVGRRDRLVLSGAGFSLCAFDFRHAEATTDRLKPDATGAHFLSAPGACVSFTCLISTEVHE